MDDHKSLARYLADNIAHPGVGTVLTVTRGGVTWRVRIHADDTSPHDHINDADCWGTVSKYAHDYHREGRTPRPGGFDGRACKIQVDRGYWIWWQPPSDVTDPDDVKNLRDEVQRLFEEGFLGVTLERIETLRDSRDREHQVVVADAGLWGIDSLDNDYLFGVLEQLILEATA